MFGAGRQGAAGVEINGDAALAAQLRAAFARGLTAESSASRQGFALCERTQSGRSSERARGPAVKEKPGLGASLSSDYR